MSASLVGSEMCIRDRSLFDGMGVVWRSLDDILTRHGLHHHLKGAFAAVSYTHLTLPTICSV
eukprot:6541798-Alexandrium_andersonii.AAC.1